jgi:Tfp pilus assembly protein PilF
MKIDPNSEQDCMHLAFICEENGNYADAKKYFQKAIQKNPKSDVAYNNLGALFLKTKDSK